MATALRLRGVTKTFGTVRAVDDLDLEIPRGTTCGFIGPSGAGKTTCIRLIMSILFPDSGELSVLGHASALAAKDRIGYLPEERGVYRRMRVGAFLAYIGKLKGVPESAARARASRLLERLGLAGVEEKRCEDLSKGMLQRVQFVAALVNEPDLLILDEPFSGLDPVSVRRMREVIADEQRRGVTLLFSTHVMSHAEELCDHVVMIHRGRKVLDEPIAGLRRQYDVRTIRLEPLDADADVGALYDVPGVASVRRASGGWELRLVADSDPVDVMRRIPGLVVPARLEFARVTLEDIFVRLAQQGGAVRDEGALRAHLQGLDVGASA
ncbi:MAG: ATP-binding cassette domain-containing protein [Acidobacteriota bacterium]|jgi:ABC-2 type transport system ATP-binding protein|nr:MAG: ABC transporter ATP-binding protein [Acidobacteriota bacterium]